MDTSKNHYAERSQTESVHIVQFYLYKMQTHLITDEYLPEAEGKGRDRLQRDKKNLLGLREMFCVLTVVVISWP